MFVLFWIMYCRALHTSLEYVGHVYLCDIYTLFFFLGPGLRWSTNMLYWPIHSTYSKPHSHLVWFSFGDYACLSQWLTTICAWQNTWWTKSIEQWVHVEAYFKCLKFVICFAGRFLSWALWSLCWPWLVVHSSLPGEDFCTLGVSLSTSSFILQQGPDIPSERLHAGFAQRSLHGCKYYLHS